MLRCSLPMGGNRLRGRAPLATFKDMLLDVVWLCHVSSHFYQRLIEQGSVEMMLSFERGSVELLRLVEGASRVVSAC